MTSSEATDVWNAAAAGWDRGYDWYARAVRPITQWICGVVATPGARVLDLACGTGQPALDIAARVGPDGRVLATDLSPRMLETVRRRARDAELGNVEVRLMDAQDLALGDRKFDAASCACGLMFCADPASTVSQVRRVLRPGGRLAVAVWDGPAHCPYFTLIGGVLQDLLPPAPGAAPSGWPLASPAEIEGVLARGGISEIAVERCSLTFELESVDHYWNVMMQFAAGIAQKVARLPPDAVERAREALRRAAQPHLQAGRLRLTATALCASGRAVA